MTTDSRLRAALLAKLEVTPQRLSQRVAQIKRLYGPMSTEDATYVLAHQEGLDLTKYLSQQIVDRVRGLLPAASSPAVPIQKKAARSASQPRPVRIAPNLELVNAGLPSSIADDASRMASVYPKLYVLENSIRNVVTRVLQSKYGKDWWDTCASAKVKLKVAGRLAKEVDAPWHGKRGVHPIFYSDFTDLSGIITRNWSEFEPILLRQSHITHLLEELEPIRNVIAHNNPLSTSEQNRLNLYFDDWIALLNDRKAHIPK